MLSPPWARSSRGSPRYLLPSTQFLGTWGLHSPHSLFQRQTVGWNHWALPGSDRHQTYPGPRYHSQDPVITPSADASCHPSHQQLNRNFRSESTNNVMAPGPVVPPGLQSEEEPSPDPSESPGLRLCETFYLWDSTVGLPG